MARRAAMVYLFCSCFAHVLNEGFSSYVMMTASNSVPEPSTNTMDALKKAIEGLKAADWLGGWAQDIDFLLAARREIAAGGFVHFHDALNLDKAMWIHKELWNTPNFTRHSDKWNVGTPPNHLEPLSSTTCADTMTFLEEEEHPTLFQFLHHNIYNETQNPPSVTAANAFFDSPDARLLFGFLAGADVPIRVPQGGFTASWYRTGDHSTVHTDGTRGAPDTDPRRLAFILHLTQDWEKAWGGALVWCAPFRQIMPTMNSLTLFAPSGQSGHFVQAVAQPGDPSADDASTDADGEDEEAHEGGAEEGTQETSKQEVRALDRAAPRRLALSGWFSPIDEEEYLSRDAEFDGFCRLDQKNAHCDQWAEAGACEDEEAHELMVEVCLGWCEHHQYLFDPDTDGEEEEDDQEGGEEEEAEEDGVTEDRFAECEKWAFGETGESDECEVNYRFMDVYCVASCARWREWVERKEL